MNLQCVAVVGHADGGAPLHLDAAFLNLSSLLRAFVVALGVIVLLEQAVGRSCNRFHY